ncbi:MAG: hypothetical protein A2015_09240 [Spirochaetes bacterium GWF1_31_7]|nr:MAG: hypothetical protein A2Y30_08980 [Spirochaetes bacterium GWE1_32_154]OHD45679.1 MAG: hypothetical protein A2Y29_10155 [Spirochaetes bacterium GWE2_31_10]OHD47672.1 MAG: hypothetical protein A2015_09240 [Spirochaetes bacterium GWF1_31_7]HBD94774.1 hypothetical protein [Spirochaetia bacterium]
MFQSYVKELYKNFLIGNQIKSGLLHIILFFSFILTKKQKNNIIYLIGLSNFQKGKYCKAEIYLRYSFINNHRMAYYCALLYIRSYRIKNAISLIKYLHGIKKNRVICEIHRVSNIDIEFDYSNFFINQILIYFKEKRYDLTNEYFENKIVNTHFEKELYVQSLFYSRQYDTIIEYFAENYKYLLDNYNLYIYARTLFKIGEYNNSLRIFKILIKYKSNSFIFVNSIQFIATIYRYSGRYFKSLRLLKKNFKKCHNVSTGKYYFNIALSYHAAGLIDKSIKWYELAYTFKILKSMVEAKTERIFITGTDKDTYSELKNIKIKKEIIEKIERKKQYMKIYSIILLFIPYSIVSVSIGIIIYFFLMG